MARPGERAMEDLRHIFQNVEHSTPFHDPDLIRMVEDYFGINSWSVLALEDGKPVGIMYVHTLKMKFPLVQHVSPFQRSHMTYGGPVAVDNRRDIIDALLRKAEKRNSSFGFYIKSIPGADPEPYIARKYNAVHAPTLMIDLSQNYEELWLGLKKRMRENINKARKNEIEVYRDKGDDIPVFHEIFRELAERVGLNCNEPDYYDRLIRATTKADKGELFMAKYRGKIITSILALIHKDVIYAWIGATLGHYNDTEAQSLVCWDMIRYGKSIGCRYFDFMGLDVGPVAFFKRGFGGQEVPVYHLSKKSLSFKIINKLYKFVS